MKRRIEKEWCWRRDDGCADRGALRERRPAVHFADIVPPNLPVGDTPAERNKNCARGLEAAKKSKAGGIFYGGACGENCDWKF